MTELTELEEGDLAAGLVGIDSYEPSTPLPRNFLPWHRPRKQAVRELLWKAQIEGLLARSTRPRSELSYLGLPGVDLLDLRHLYHSVCEARQLKLRFLGFVRAARPGNRDHVDLNVSLDEVRRLPLVDPDSDVVGDDFIQLAREQSVACQRARDLGPFDVVNLDLCDGIAAQVPGGKAPNYYNAVASLLALQARRKEPWLFFLTTRVGDCHIAPEMLEKIGRILWENVERCERFQEICREHVGGVERSLLEAALRSGDTVVPFVTCGIFKWMLKMVLMQSPPSACKLASVIGYRVVKECGHPDLVSIALLFTPELGPGYDPSGIARVSSVSLQERECSSAADGLRVARTHRDADSLLRDVEFRQRMIDATEDLLVMARYDRVKYREWLAQTEA